MKKYHISICIPAYNESANIASFIRSLLSQTRYTYILDKIIVISDGSSDQTCEKVYGMNTKLVQCICDTKRQGKPYRINQLFTMSQSEIILIFDADLTLSGINIIDSLIQPFYKNKLVQFVSGWATPKKPENIVQRIAFTNVSIWRKAVTFHRDAELYYSSGSIGAYGKRFYKSLRFKNFSADDAYAYIACRENGYQFHHVDNLGISYTLPSLFMDYIRQWTRFLHSQSISNNLFNQKIVQQYYVIGSYEIIRAMLWSFFHDPFWTLIYILSRIVIEYHALRDNSEHNSLWTIASSTKLIL